MEERPGGDEEEEEDQGQKDCLGDEGGEGNYQGKIILVSKFITVPILSECLPDCGR